jgi:general L-amino acid transport system ATP-binding protein
MPHVDIEGVNKWFGDLHVLREISLSVARGERLVICGPSGSGKSTLIRCINRLEVPQSGRIVVGGDVGMVFQQFNLFPHLTVMENCTLAPVWVKRASRQDAVDRAMYYLQQVGIAEQARKYPAQLSGGQQQRAAIARSLCMSPQIMLFDEPTSSLDPEAVNEVLETMVALADEGMTMICVTHEMRFARRVANRVVFMDAGRIVEVSAPDAFFDAPRHPRAQEFLSRVLA